MGNYQVVDRCDFQSGSAVNNQYTVKKTLGEGSFGVVYLVEDHGGQKYALKCAYGRYLPISDSH